MPSLRTMPDVEELDNRYIDKCIIYVEGESDLTVWERIVGPNVADRVEFKVPQAVGSGYTLVCQRVARERQTNPRIFGLVDGEIAAVHDKIDKLIASVEPIFVLDDPALDGILFLAEHEAENVLLRYSELPNYVLNDFSLAKGSTRTLKDSRTRITATIL